MFSGLPTHGIRGTDILIIEWLTLALALIAVGLRLHSRRISLNVLGWDDYTVLAVTVFALAQAVIGVIQVDSGLGQHGTTLTPHQVSAIIKWKTINDMLQILGTLLVRLSCCLLVLRMPPVGHTKQLHARAIYILLMIFVIVSTVSFLLLCFQCTPLQGLWNNRLHAHCIPTEIWHVIQTVDGTFEVVMNLLTASLPFIFLLNPQSRPRDKWGTLTIAFLAYGTAGPSVCRVYSGIGGDNLSWDLACIQICSSAEQNIGTIVATIPTLGDTFSIFLNHTSTSFIGRNLWPNPPLPSCWEESQNDDIPMQDFSSFPEWQFDLESREAGDCEDFWRSVDSQIGNISFDGCARPQSTYDPSKPNSTRPCETRSRWDSRPNSQRGSRSSSYRFNEFKSTTPKRSPSPTTTPKGTPPSSTTPTSTPPESPTSTSIPPKSTSRTSTPPTAATPTFSPPKSNTPGSSEPNSIMHTRRPGIDISPGTPERRSFRSRIPHPSSWMRWSWRAGDDPGYEPTKEPKSVT